MKNKIRYTCQGYKYAPESFKCYMVVINADGYNHSYYELESFTHKENTRVGIVCISKGKRAAEAEIKKIIRGKKEYYNNITYGYKSLDGGTITYLQWEKIDNDASIKNKLAIYKMVKEYYKEKNYIITEYSCTSFELGEECEVINQHKKEEKLILDTKPIKITFINPKKEK